MNRINLLPLLLLALVVVCQSQTRTTKDVGEVAYPYELHQMDFISQRQELQMTYMYEKAKEGNGKTVLLLHGKNFSGLYWGKVMDKLMSKGYNVIAPDQVGFGSSSMPANYEYSFQQLAMNTAKLLDTLKIKKVIVLGHSMGGMLATRFALLFPERTEQLILENPIGLEDWKLLVPYTTIDQEYKKELGKTHESVKKYMVENYFHNEWKNDYDFLLAEFDQSIATAEYKEQAWNMALTSDMIFTQPVCYEFAKLQVPTVLIIGQKDRTAIGKDKVSKEKAAEMGNYSALGKLTASKISNCMLVEMPDAGHIPHVEQFDLFMVNLSNVMVK
ncbi:MAG: alpha/beta hydrolase [Bacteroidota bacterium]|nr:alpha/beta hydrolase [Bacteroidota bacterium]